MATHTQSVDNIYPGNVGSVACPHCKGVAYRVPRRWIDRLTSHWRPVWRYECQTLHCRRTFNLPGGR